MSRLNDVTLEYLDRRLDDLLFPEDPNEEKCWTTLDGRRIPISKLENSHLANIIRFLERKVRENRGSIAGITSYDLVSLDYPIYKYLVAEQKKRGKVSNPVISFILKNKKNG